MAAGWQTARDKGERACGSLRTAGRAVVVRVVETAPHEGDKPPRMSRVPVAAELLVLRHVDKPTQCTFATTACRPLQSHWEYCTEVILQDRV